MSSISIAVTSFVPVTVFQILPKGVLIILAEAGSTKQAAEEAEKKAALNAGLAQSVTRAAVHVHDGGAVRTPEGAGPALQR